mmetsp:Transcript_19861/g.18034  ORF Transcript_19861/g.18034 Transcript_19861/m.18034 type:complete len:247 (+) Transcript_19861:233-973(+)
MSNSCTLNSQSFRGLSSDDIKFYLNNENKCLVCGKLPGEHPTPSGNAGGSTGGSMACIIRVLACVLAIIFLLWFSISINEDRVYFYKAIGISNIDDSYDKAISIAIIIIAITTSISFTDRIIIQIASRFLLNNKPNDKEDSNLIDLESGTTDKYLSNSRMPVSEKSYAGFGKITFRGFICLLLILLTNKSLIIDRKIIFICCNISLVLNWFIEMMLFSKNGKEDLCKFWESVTSNASKKFKSKRKN